MPAASGSMTALLMASGPKSARRGKAWYSRSPIVWRRMREMMFVVPLEYCQTAPGAEVNSLLAANPAISARA